MNYEATLTGDLSGALDKLEQKVSGEVLLSGVAAMAHVIYDEVRLNASRHVKSGKLYDAIYRVYAEDRSTETQKTYRVSWNHTKAPHGHLIEFGTSRAPAYPFLRPAFDHVGEAIQAGQARIAQRLAE